jgi:acyl-CoA synthetase (AMP-forming)/AMP-acid ligase II
MTRRAAHTVYEAAGIAPEDIDLLELHDCFTVAEVMFSEALGLCPEGALKRWSRTVITPTLESSSLIRLGACSRKDIHLALPGPQRTAEAIQNGWLYTGDAGYRDCDGCLWYSDRLKDMVKPKGENVSSAEVEATIASHPKVNDVGIIGAPRFDGLSSGPGVAPVALDRRLPSYLQ